MHFNIELPEDIAAEDCDERIFDVVGFRRPDADKQAIQQAAKMIEEAKMPLLLIGGGANRKRTSAALTQFIDKTGIPFFNTQKGKGVDYMEDNVKWHYGSMDSTLADQARQSVDKFYGKA